MRASGPISLHTSNQLVAHDGLVAGCSGRQGGVSEAPYDELNLSFNVGDDPAAVRENRERLAAAIDLTLHAFVVPHQVHRDHVEVIGRNHRGRGALSREGAIPDTDALITAEPGVVLAITLADCVPIILYDPFTPAVGLAHAGWSGTVHHIAAKTVAAMCDVFGSDTSSLLASLGPSIGPDSYVVGSEVAEQIRYEYPGIGLTRAIGNGKALLDLWAANAADLESAGVAPTNIEIARIDTFQRTDDFFSARRQHPTGRFMSVAVLCL